MSKYRILRLYDNVARRRQWVEHDDTIEFEADYDWDQTMLNELLFVLFHLRVHRLLPMAK
jgi:hypothetical protein